VLPAALTSALLRCAQLLGAADVPWLVAGGTARALSGFATPPRDLDVEVPAEHMAEAADALGLTATTAIDPGARSTRAMGHLEGVEIDLTAGLVLTGPGGILPPDFDLMSRFAESVDLGGVHVRVMPPEEQIVRILVAGDEERRLRFVGEAPAGYVPREDYVSARLGSARAIR